MRFTRKYILFLLFFLPHFPIFSFFPINIFQPYDINLRPERIFGKNIQIAVGYEGGKDFKGFQDDGYFGRVFCNRVNVLQLYQNDVDALAMLKGFPEQNLIASFSQQFNIGSDDGIRGHLIPQAELDIRANILCSAYYHLPYNFSVAAHLPFISMRLKNVQFFDQTRDVRFEDQLVKELLTNDFSENVMRLGGPSLASWQRDGIGDLVTMITWLKNFPQTKPALKNVRLITRFAISWPTGEKRNEDELLAIPFGNDGAVGLIFGAGLDLTFAEILRGGGYVEFLHQFSDIKERRIKTDVTQTDLFFLGKETAYKEHGINEQFNLYLEGWHFWRGLSARIVYQFFKKREDRLWLFSDCFDQTIANTAGELLDATFHNMIFMIKYNFDPWGFIPTSPELILFAKHGLNGKRSILGNTFGFRLSMSF